MLMRSATSLSRSRAHYNRCCEPTVESTKTPRSGRGQTHLHDSCVAVLTTETSVGIAVAAPRNDLSRLRAKVGSHTGWIECVFNLQNFCLTVQSTKEGKSFAD